MNITDLKECTVEVYDTKQRLYTADFNFPVWEGVGICRETGDKGIVVRQSGSTFFEPFGTDGFAKEEIPGLRAEKPRFETPAFVTRHWGK
jgi:hypothetical protein